MDKNTIIEFLVDNGFDRSKLEAIKDENKMLLSLVKAVSWLKQFEFIQSLYFDKFIPAAEKLDEEVATEILLIRKKYDVEIKNESQVVNETVRFGYLALYHKLENCRKEILKFILPVFEIKEELFLSEFKQKFGYDFKKPNSGIIYKFSWISDCTKHQNAIASERNNPPIEFLNYPIGKQISINKDVFLSDSELLRKTFKELCFQSVFICAIEELKNL